MRGYCSALPYAITIKIGATGRSWLLYCCRYPSRALVCCIWSENGPPGSISMVLCMELMSRSKKGKIHSNLRVPKEKRSPGTQAPSSENAISERSLSPSSGISYHRAGIAKQKVLISRGDRGMPRRPRPSHPKHRSLFRARSVRADHASDSFVAGAAQ